MSDRRVPQPGLFVASRPVLAVLLVLASLGLVGFSGGALLDPAIRARFFIQMQGYGSMAVLAMLACLVPVLAPPAAWGRVLLALGVFFAGLLAFSFGGATASGPLAMVLLGAGVTAALILLTPLTGRWLPLFALLSPLASLAGLAGLAGWLARHEVSYGSALLSLQTLSLCTALMTGVFFLERLSRFMAAGEGLLLGVALGLNAMMRDVFFLSFSGALMFAFYVRDEVALGAGGSLLWTGFAGVLACALPALMISAAVMAVLPKGGPLGDARQRANRVAAVKLGPVQKRLTPAIYLAGLVIVTILVSVFVGEVPLTSFTAKDVGDSGGVSVLLRGLFYVSVFALTAVFYVSLRMAAVVLVVFLLGDLLTSILFSDLIYNHGGVMRLVDVTPRLMVLYLLVQLVAAWRRGVATGASGREDGVALALQLLGPGSFAILVCAVIFVANSLFVEGGAMLADYAVLRLLMQTVLSLLILPMAMAVFSRFRVSI